MFSLTDYIAESYKILPILGKYSNPWDITSHSIEIVKEIMSSLSDGYIIRDNVAIHQSAIVESNITFKGPTIIGENCFIGANAYFREGVYLANDVKIGPSSEIKASFIFSCSAVAHLNYIGNSMIGSHVNIEAGAVFAVHYNERDDKKISVKIDGQVLDTGIEKFGSLVGDNVRIGANAVLSPGIVLKPGTIVDRLQLVV
jgi:NDP-sugar pyrophosphorylase family protein